MVEFFQRLLTSWTTIHDSLAQARPKDKLQEEVDEFLAEENQTNEKLEEGADVIIVVLTDLTSDGFSVEDISSAVISKLNVNIHRKWEVNEDGTLSHIKA